MHLSHAKHATITVVATQFLTAADAPAAVRLALHDAGTYDIATKTGGFDGSIALKCVPVSLENLDAD